MTALDAYATLGLAPGATQAEIKRAYRQLAKEHHPDRGGPAELPRFLAIQAAYEQLTSGRALGPGGRSWPGGGGTAGGGPGPARPWQADPARARTTREQWRRRAGGAAGSAGTSRPGGPTSTGTGSSTDAGASASSRGARTGGGASAGPHGAGHAAGHGSGGSARGSANGRHHHRRKATPGSTTYDDALREPSEPDWLGSAWYGQASGTYWTINPREYADPRKHGPEYQQRARRAVRASAMGGLADQSASPGPAAEPPRDAAGGTPRGGGEGVRGPAPASTGTRTHQTHAARPRTAGASPEFGRRSWARPAASAGGAGDWAASTRPTGTPPRPEAGPLPAEPARSRPPVPEPGETRRPDPASPPHAGRSSAGPAPEGSAPEGSPSAPEGSAPEGSGVPVPRGLGGRLGRLLGRGARGDSSGH